MTTVIFEIINNPTLFPVLAMDNIPLWLALVSSMAVGVLAAVCVRGFLVPYYKRRLVAPPVNFSLGLSNGE